jgi:DNA-binding CsgD family transcriptional regulator
MAGGLDLGSGGTAADLGTLGLIASFTSATTEAELLQRMRAFARSIGYDQALFGLQVHMPGMAPLQHITSGYPDAYQQLYLERGFVERDPTVAHCQGNTTPLEWSEQIYDAHSYEIMEESRKYGLGWGFSLSVHESDQSASMLSLARDRPVASEAERRLVLAASSVMAHCLHVAAKNIILPGVLAGRRPRLSPREAQCLQLVAIGKSNWDIGQLLNISEAAAAFHVKNLLKKFKVSTRVQAVAMGVALRMIT